VAKRRFEVIYMPSKLPDSHKRHLVQLYASGVSSKEIARRFGHDPKWVLKIIRRFGGEVRGTADAQLATWGQGRIAYQLRTDLDVAIIVASYHTGQSITTIAEALG